MTEKFTDRTARIIGDAGIQCLQSKKVLLFGVGGVGSYVAEALGRSGIGSLTLVDKDRVDITNINRQLIALHSTVGQVKVEVMARRLKDINPAIKVISRDMCYLPENAEDFDFGSYDYVVDAIDMVTAKLSIIEASRKAGVPVIASMGTGNKLDPSQFEITDISKTSVCPLARVMRRELKARGITKVKVLYSKEQPAARISPPGSMAFVPSVAGLMIAGEVVRDLLHQTEETNR